MKYITLLFLSFFGFLCHGQELFMEFIPGSTGSDPSSFFEWKGKMYFGASLNNAKREIITVDLAGKIDTLKQANPNTASLNSSYPSDFVDLDDILVYVDDRGNGPELWSYDGLNFPVEYEIDTVSTFKRISNLTRVGENIYFIFFNASGVRELWKFDGKNNPYNLNITSGQSNTEFVYQLIEYQGQLYYGATTGSTGGELWRLEDDQPVLVSDILQGPQGSEPQEFVKYKNLLVFRAKNSTNSGLYTFDGSSPPKQVDLSAGSNTNTPSFLYSSNNYLYFDAEDDDEGRELWQFDGVSAKRISLNPGNKDSSPRFFFSNEDVLYFRAADTGSSTTNELWIYDEIAQTARVFNLNVIQNKGSNPRNFTLFNDTIYFTGDSHSGNGMFRNPVNKETPNIYAPFFEFRNSFPQKLFVFNGDLYFTTRFDDAGTELWIKRGNCKPGIISSSDQTLIELCDPDTVTFNFIGSLNEADKWYLFADSLNSSALDSTITNTFKIPGNRSGTFYISSNKVCGRDSEPLEINLELTQINTQIINNGELLASLETDADSYQWIKCDNDSVLPQATKQTLRVPESGMYKVALVKGSCTDTSDCVQVNVTSIAQKTIESLAIYPNPFKNQITISKIDLKNLAIERIRLVSTSGQTIYDHEVSPLSDLIINTQHLDKGGYILQLFNGQQWSGKKMVKN